MSFVQITDVPIHPPELLSRVGGASDGAVLLFLGTVRDLNDGRAVDGMDYQAYREMAEEVLQEIADEVAARWSTDRLAVIHRTGALEVGEVSVAIAVSTPHRAEAYDASRHVIEQIKARLPVWKREHYRDGERRWVPGRRPPVPSAEAPAEAAAHLADGGAP